MQRQGFNPLPQPAGATTSSREEELTGYLNLNVRTTSR